MLSKLRPPAASDNPRALTAVEPDSTGLPRVWGLDATDLHPTDAVQVGWRKANLDECDPAYTQGWERGLPG